MLCNQTCYATKQQIMSPPPAHHPTPSQKQAFKCSQHTHCQPPMCSGFQYWCTDRLSVLPSSVYQGKTYLSSGITGSLVVSLWVIGPSKISGAEVGEANRISVGLAFLRRELEDCFGDNYIGDEDEKSERTPRRQVPLDGTGGSRVSIGEAVAAGRAAARRETKAMRVDENCIVAVVSWRRLDE